MEKSKTNTRSITDATANTLQYAVHDFVARIVALGGIDVCSVVMIMLANVRDDGSPLAFGMTPAREAESAGGMTKVPKAW
jgi:hypothetical protein